MTTILRALLYWLAVKPFVALVLGTHVKGLNHLPESGPVILAANHNSHLDTLVMLSLFPFRQLHRVRPVAAGDYFLKTRFRRWFALNIVRVIPIERQPKRSDGHPLAPCIDALDRGDILAIFPEGSRGDPEQRRPFKKGIAHLVEARPEVPVIPVFLKGTGKALPKGEALLVPHVCELSFGEPVTWRGDRCTFMEELTDRFETLSRDFPTKHLPILGDHDEKNKHHG